MKNKYLSLHLPIILVLNVSCLQNEKQLSSCTNKEPLSPVIMAYYVPEKDFDPEQIPVEQLTHIIYSFSNFVDGKMIFTNPAESGSKLKAIVQQKKRNPNLKVMIACGGWGTDGFSDMALNNERRSAFIESAKSFITTYHLDGLDIDWEYPGISGAGTKARKEDTQNFTALMKGLREMLDTFKSPKILTFASAGWKLYYDHIEVEEVMKYVDYINVMTYDQVSGVSEYTGHHSPLGHVLNEDMVDSPFKKHMDSLYRKGINPDPHPRSIKKITDYLIEIGVTPKQIVIGAAFYGRVWKGVPPTNNGLYQLSTGIHTGWLAYHNIRKSYETDEHFVRYWDDDAKAPYLYNATDSLMVSYDDTVSVAQKTRFARDNELGGIMFWELGNDTKESGSLLDAIYYTATE